GEPLLPSTHSFVTRILEAAGREALPVNIVTNGVHVADFLELFQKYYTRLNSVQITLDGPRDVHDCRRPGPDGAGSYEAIVTSIDLLLEAGIHVFLRINVDISTVSQLPRLAEIMKQRDWIDAPGLSCSLAPIQDHTGSGIIPNAGPNDRLLDALLDVYDQSPESENTFGLQGFPVVAQVSACLTDQGATPRVSHCEANQGGFWLAGPEGLLYACPETIGQPELAIGRFLPEFEVFDDQRKLWVERDILSLDKCRICKFATLCGGGCTYASIVRRGDAHYPVCEENIEESVKVFLSRRAVHG
ncbi:MAG: SPASM domain-containing protein, partial [Actinomycetota bacterium]